MFLLKRVNERKENLYGCNTIRDNVTEDKVVIGITDFDYNQFSLSEVVKQSKVNIAKRQQKPIS